MRAEDRAEIGGDYAFARHFLLALYRQSDYRRTALVDGEVAAVWGDHAPPMVTDGHIWLLTAPAIERVPLAFFREARREIAKLLQVRSMLRADTAATYDKAIRFWKMLGFEIAPVGSDGSAARREITISKPTGGAPFIVYALPRSRTAWIAAFLTYGNWRCHHERAVTIRTIGEARRLLARPNTGSAETSAGPAWRLLRRWSPDHKAVVIRRPIEETVRSMMIAGADAGITYDESRLRAGMQYGARCLAEISAQTGTLTIDYRDLDSEDACRELFEFCLPYDFDSAWWEKLNGQNVQVDLRTFFADYYQNRASVEAFKRACKIEMFRLVRAGEMTRA